LLQQYDKNHDGKLDESEKEAMRKDQETKRKEFIAKYDKNGDGKLDESEMAAARADRRKAAEAKKAAPKPEEKK
jgi:Ca2+-binding EF-hand superfamily protein